jgi:hypothetical protein
VNSHKVLSVEDAKAVLRGTQSPRELARLTWALVLGLRQGEALGLRWIDLDLKAAVIHIQVASSFAPKLGAIQQTPKSRTSAREIPLPSSVAAILRAWEKMAPENDLVFASATGYCAQPTSPTTSMGDMIVIMRFGIADSALKRDIPYADIMHIVHTSGYLGVLKDGLLWWIGETRDGQGLEIAGFVTDEGDAIILIHASQPNGGNDDPTGHPTV